MKPTNLLQKKDAFSFFSRLFLGRINRKSNIIGEILIALLLPPLYFLPSDTFNPFFILLEIILSSIIVLYTFSFAIRRLHDTNHSGFLSLLLFIPFGNAFMGLYLLFQPGTVGNNKYGSAPQKQTLKQILGIW